MRSEGELDWKVVAKDSRLQGLDKATFIRFGLHQTLLRAVKDGRVQPRVPLLVRVDDVLPGRLNHEQELAQRPAPFPQHILGRTRNYRAQREDEEVHIPGLV